MAAADPPPPLWKRLSSGESFIGGRRSFVLPEALQSLDPANKQESAKSPDSTPTIKAWSPNRQPFCTAPLSSSGTVHRRGLTWAGTPTPLEIPRASPPPQPPRSPQPRHIPPGSGQGHPAPRRPPPLAPLASGMGSPCPSGRLQEGVATGDVGTILPRRPPPPPPPGLASLAPSPGATPSAPQRDVLSRCSSLQDMAALVIEPRDRTWVAARHGGPSRLLFSPQGKPGVVHVVLEH